MSVLSIGFFLYEGGNKVKKILISILVVLLSITLISCSYNESPQTENNGLEEVGNNLETTELDENDIEDVEDEKIVDELSYLKNPQLRESVRRSI